MNTRWSVNVCVLILVLALAAAAHSPGGTPRWLDRAVALAAHAVAAPAALAQSTRPVCARCGQPAAKVLTSTKSGQVVRSEFLCAVHAADAQREIDRSGVLGVLGVAAIVGWLLLRRVKLAPSLDLALQTLMVWVASLFVCALVGGLLTTLLPDSAPWVAAAVMVLALPASLLVPWRFWRRGRARLPATS